MDAGTVAAAAYERALVRSGWETVDLLGHLDPQQSTSLLSYRWESERQRGTHWFLDFVRPSDRILEVGAERGAVQSVLERDGVAAYLGHDDLLSLDADLLRDFGPDLVLCLDTLAWLEDPEKGLVALAHALPDDTELLIAVPIEGRLETVWQHVAIFDGARTRAMVEGSGLHVHAVDVCQDRWAYVLASHRSEPSGRAAAAAGAAIDGRGLPSAGSGPTSFKRVDLTSAGPARDPRRLRGQLLVHGPDASVTCTIAATPLRLPRPGRHSGGIAFGVDRARGLRLELDLTEADGLQALIVDAYDGMELVSRWKWDVAKRPPGQPEDTYVFGDERPSAFFTPIREGEFGQADTIELVAEVRAGATATFRLNRASVLR